jgi:hypothetical protein
MVEGALITNALAYKSSGALQEKTKNTVLHAAAPPSSRARAPEGWCGAAGAPHQANESAETNTAERVKHANRCKKADGTDDDPRRAI